MVWESQVSQRFQKCETSSDKQPGILDKASKLQIYTFCGSKKTRTFNRLINFVDEKRYKH